MDSVREDLPGRPVSLWSATTPETGYPVLQGEVNVDVAIVGGGLAGVSAAHYLKHEGKSVAVIEALTIGQGVTGNTTAKVTSLHALKYDALIRRFGTAVARAYGEANEAGIREVRRLVEELNIDCDLKTTTAYTYTEDPSEVDAFRAEADAGARIGLPLELTTETPLPFAVAAAVRLADQSQFHPLKFLQAVAERLPGDGSHVFERSRVVEYKHGSPCRVRTDGGTVTAKDVIIATNHPIGDKALYSLRMTPKRSHVLGVRLADAVPAGLKESMLLGTRPRYSVRTAPGEEGEVLIVGGEGHTTGEGGSTAERYLRLEEWARRRFGELETLYRWSAHDPETLDGVPYIGRAAPRMDHLYVVTGFGKWGMAHSLVAGMLLRDLVVGRSNPWAEVYDPKRVNLHGAMDLLEMGARSTRHLVLDRLSGPQQWGVPRGEGRVVRDEEGMVALYRDADGNLTRLSAACTHMGCVVAWNDGELSWDCPCHGSRFRPDGSVIRGPAVRPLKRLPPR